VLVALVGIAAAAAAAPACLRLSGQPCSSGRECPTGYACSQGTCESVAGDGATVVVHVGLPGDGINRQDIEELVLESYLDNQLGCLLFRDPDDVDRFNTLEPAVSVPVNLGDPPTVVRLPAGRNVILIRAKSADGDDLADDVGRSCQVRDYSPGAWDALWITLARANGRCGDGIVDVGEQCDGTDTGSSMCAPPGDPRGGCTTIPAVLADGSCITEPAVDCIWNHEEGDASAGRCFVGWIEDGWRVHVVPRFLVGSEDTDGDEVLGDGGDPHLLRIAASREQATAIWVADGVINGRTMSSQAQVIAEFDLGDAPGAVLTFGDYFDPGDGTAVFRAGYLDASGAGRVRTQMSDEAWELRMASPPGEDAVAALFPSGAVLTWTVPDFGGGTGLDVVASGVAFGGDPAGSEPALVSEPPPLAQSDPALTRVDGDRAFIAWTDANQEAGGDQLGTGIRGRRMHYSGNNDSVAINSTTEGDQRAVAVATGHEFVVAAWIDVARDVIAARYLDNAGQPQYRPFGDGTNTDFVVADAVPEGRPVVGVGELVVFLWLEGDACGDGGGTTLMMRMLPPPH
jgi:hypothetical protein